MIVEEYNQAVDLHSDVIFRFILKNCRDEPFLKKEKPPNLVIQGVLF